MARTVIDINDESLRAVGAGADLLHPALTSGRSAGLDLLPPSPFRFAAERSLHAAARSPQGGGHDHDEDRACRQPERPFRVVVTVTATRSSTSWHRHADSQARMRSADRRPSAVRAERA